VFIKNPRRHIAGVTLIFLLNVLCACRLVSPGSTLALKFPELSEEWQGCAESIYFEVCYVDAAGIIVLEIFPAEERNATVTVMKGLHGPLTATPVWTDGSVLGLPAGAVFPYSLEAGGQVTLSWEHGFGADLLLRLYRQGFPLSCFNVERFLHEVDLRGMGNPWDLDREAILEKILQGGFRSDCIKRKEPFTGRVVFPPGDWSSWNVFDQDAPVIGFHRFFDFSRAERDGVIGAADLMLVGEGEYTLLTWEIKCGELIEK
jgi:hypothetical protein